jgi:hypothetical protein
MCAAAVAGRTRPRRPGAAPVNPGRPGGGPPVPVVGPKKAGSCRFDPTRTRRQAPAEPGSRVRSSQSLGRDRDSPSHCRPKFESWSESDGTGRGTSSSPASDTVTGRPGPVAARGADEAEGESLTCEDRRRAAGPGADRAGELPRHMSGYPSQLARRGPSSGGQTRQPRGRRKCTHVYSEPRVDQA